MRGDARSLRARSSRGGTPPKTQGFSLAHSGIVVAKQWDMNPRTSSRLRPAPTIRASRSADGLVLLDIRGGELFAANAVGAHIWELLEQELDRDVIVDRLAAHYDVDRLRLQSDVGAFVDALVARQILEEIAPC